MLDSNTADLNAYERRQARLDEFYEDNKEAIEERAVDRLFDLPADQFKAAFQRFDTDKSVLEIAMTKYGETVEFELREECGV